ncbi:aminopeptidase P family protein [Raineyella sp. LH-20]|uniref:aminopeptidase P family protein n=1 Tax=Raineyella sp. LH-20 TaxID=3081204 RepID=UPI00398599CE
MGAMAEDEVTTTEKLPNRQSPFSEAFRTFIVDGWAPYSSDLPDRLPAADPAAVRRSTIGAAFPGERLVVPAGGLKVRNNDCDYRFRPHSAFAHLSGLGTDREPNAVLVLEPTDGGHEATLYFKPRAPRTDEEFYASSRYGEMWVGQRESLDEMAAMTGLACAPIDQLPAALAKNAGSTRIRIVREADAELTAQVDTLREDHGVRWTADSEQSSPDDELATALSELRLTKDAFEVDQMQLACDRTAAAFTEVVRSFPDAVAKGRGERWVEGVFGLYARHEGNAVGYDTIAAAGDHACTLHWIRNDGEVRDGDLILIDAGIEVDTLYTADITRTLPVNGRFSDAQRKVYQAVLDAADAAIAVCRPGTTFKDVHQTAITVLAERLYAWGLLPVTPEVSVSEEGGQHRRWMVHGTSHHLGIDVHDCAQARNENYRLGTLREGMVITVEPGLYFKSTDLLVPEELRGIGVRIEDDVLITADGPRVLSDTLPRRPEEIEAWMEPLLEG